MESLAADLETMVRMPLADTHVEAMRKIGHVRDYAAGEPVVRLGNASDTFFYILEGEVEAIDPRTDARYGTAAAGPTQFFGEIDFLNGGRAMLGGRAVTRAKLLCVDRTEMLALMARVPEMSDIIVQVFAGRRRRFFEVGLSALVLVGAAGDRALRRLESFAARNRIAVTTLEPGLAPGARPPRCRRCRPRGWRGAVRRAGAGTIPPRPPWRGSSGSTCRSRGRRRSTWRWWAAGRPASPPRSTPGPRGCAAS